MKPRRFFVSVDSSPVVRLLSIENIAVRRATNGTLARWPQKESPARGGAFGPARRGTKPGQTPYIIPSIPPMPPPGGIAGPSSFFGFSATVASVVISSPAIDAAF